MYVRVHACMQMCAHCCVHTVMHTQIMTKPHVRTETSLFLHLLMCGLVMSLLHSQMLLVCMDKNEALVCMYAQTFAKIYLFSVLCKVHHFYILNASYFEDFVL